MMKWGRRKPKPPSSSPSRNSSISHVFPMSWLSKLMKNSGPKPTKEKQKATPNTAANCRDGRFFGGDDESYWRVSFGEEGFDGENKCRGGLKSFRHYSDDELEFGSSRCPKCRERQEVWKFNDMVSDIINTRGSPETDLVEREEKRKDLKEPRRRVVKDQKSTKTSRSVLQEKPEVFKSRSDKAEQKGIITEDRKIFELESTRINQKVQTPEFGKHSFVSSLNTRIPSLKRIEEDYAPEALNLEENKEEMSSKGRPKEIKIKDFLLKNEKQRKSVYTSSKGKFRVYSPRMVGRIECKIKPIEDMKRAKMKIKKKTKAVESTSSFDSFAVAKSSFDPQRDFRNSMIEMITEKEIRRSDELEELLSCYLTLNADEYHDVIIKVFRKVWFELNQVYFSPVSYNE